ncbi:MAG: VOC family protein [Pseudomonadota bacterium]
MGAVPKKDAIDLGIVTTNGDAMLEFYRDVLGFRHEGDISLEEAGIKVMHRLWFADSLIKIVVPVSAPTHSGPPGGIPESTGYRYWTLTVENLEDVVHAVRSAGLPVVWEPREIRPGVTVAMVEDPDGNWVEFLQPS